MVPRRRRRGVRGVGFGVGEGASHRVEIEAAMAVAGVGRFAMQVHRSALSSVVSSPPYAEILMTAVVLTAAVAAAVASDAYAHRLHADAAPSHNPVSAADAAHSPSFVPNPVQLLAGYILHGLDGYLSDQCPIYSPAAVEVTAPDALAGIHTAAAADQRRPWC